MRERPVHYEVRSAGDHSIVRYECIRAFPRAMSIVVESREPVARIYSCSRGTCVVYQYLRSISWHGHSGTVAKQLRAYN